MLVADMVEGANDAPLEEAVVALRKVRVEDDAVNEGAAVVHRVVAVELLIEARIREVGIGYGYSQSGPRFALQPVAACPCERFQSHTFASPSRPTSVMTAVLLTALWVRFRWRLFFFLPPTKVSSAGQLRSESRANAAYAWTEASRSTGLIGERPERFACEGRGTVSSASGVKNARLAPAAAAGNRGFTRRGVMLCSPPRSAL